MDQLLVFKVFQFCVVMRCNLILLYIYLSSIAASINININYGSYLVGGFEHRQEISLGTAHCLFNGEGTGKVVGKIIIEQHKNEEQPYVTHFRGEVSGLSRGLHGFHIHEKGDLGDNCKQAGGHFNPHGVNHGGKDAKERHVGDLGNLEAGEDGIMKINVEDHMVQLIGPHSIFGKAIVIHEGEDDLGLGGDKGSITTGNAGPRAGCCIIQ